MKSDIVHIKPDISSSNAGIVNTLKGFVKEANADPPVEVVWTMFI